MRQNWEEVNEMMLKQERAKRIIELDNELIKYDNMRRTSRGWNKIVNAQKYFDIKDELNRILVSK